MAELLVDELWHHCLISDAKTRDTFLQRLACFHIALDGRLRQNPELDFGPFAEDSKFRMAIGFDHHHCYPGADRMLLAAQELQRADGLVWSMRFANDLVILYLLKNKKKSRHPYHTMSIVINQKVKELNNGPFAISKRQIGAIKSTRCDNWNLNGDAPRCAKYSWQVCQKTRAWNLAALALVAKVCGSSLPTEQLSWQWAAN